MKTNCLLSFICRGLWTVKKLEKFSFIKKTAKNFSTSNKKLESNKTSNDNLFNPFSSSAPPANGFSQMARMMDSLILDSLSTTPFAFTKITTHRPVKKATSTNHLPTNGMSSSTSSNQARNTFLHSNKKIPTQGKPANINHNFGLRESRCFVLHILSCL
jgi:hypothetical protein